MMDELGQRRRSASISLDEGVMLMPSRVVPPVAGEVVKGHKRQVSNTLLVLRQASRELEQKGGKGQDDDAAPSSLSNLQPSKVAAGPSAEVPARRSSVTFDETAEVIGGDGNVEGDLSLSSPSKIARFEMGRRRPSGEHVATPIPSPRRNSLCLSPVRGLETPPHLSQEGGRAELEDQVAQSTEDQLAASDDDAGIEEGEADDDDPTPFVPVEPTPLDERPAGPFPAPLMGHTDSGGAASDTSALSHGPEKPSPQAELGTRAGDGTGAGIGLGSAVADSSEEGPVLLKKTYADVLREAGGPPTPSIGGVGVSSATGMGQEFKLGLLDEAGALLGRRRSGSKGEEAIGEAEAVERLMSDEMRSGREGRFEVFRKEVGGQGEGGSTVEVDVGGLSLGHARDATWATEDGEQGEGELGIAAVADDGQSLSSEPSSELLERSFPPGQAGGDDDNGDDDSGPDVDDSEAVDPTFSPDLSTSTQASSPSTSPRRHPLKTSPSATSSKGSKSPARSSPTKLSSGGSSTAKAAKAREAAAALARAQAKAQGGAVVTGEWQGEGGTTDDDDDKKQKSQGRGQRGGIGRVCKISDQYPKIRAFPSRIPFLLLCTFQKCNNFVD